MEKTIEELHLNLQRMHIRRPAAPNRPETAWDKKLLLVQVCIFAAFYPNYFVRSYGFGDMRDVHKAINMCDPTNTV